MIAVMLPTIPGPTLGLAAVVAAAAGLWLLLPRGHAGRLRPVAGALLAIASVPGFWLAGRGLPDTAGLGAWLPLAFAVALVAGGAWLLLPAARGLGGRLLACLAGAPALAALGFLAWRLGGLGVEQGVFLLVSLVAVVAATATVVSRSPVYAAIWFALALVGVAGVLLVLGAQFLGIATIVVYAGAILVMFLFVLMLAQPSGMAPYDRVSNEPLLAALAGAALLGLLSLSIGRLTVAPATGDAPPAAAAADAPAPAAQPAADPLAVDQVARLGGALFGRHLLAVEVAGVLLLVALVGSIAVVARAGDHSGELARRPVR